MFTHNIFFSCLWQQDGQLTELPDGLWKNSVLLSQTILTNNDIEYVVCVDVAAAVVVDHADDLPHDLRYVVELGILGLLHDLLELGQNCAV